MFLHNVGKCNKSTRDDKRGTSSTRWIQTVLCIIKAETTVGNQKIRVGTTTSLGRSTDPLVMELLTNKGIRQRSLRYCAKRWCSTVGVNINETDYCPFTSRSISDPRVLMLRDRELEITNVVK